MTGQPEPHTHVHDEKPAGMVGDRLRLMFDWYKGMVDESTGRLLYLDDPENDVTIGNGELIRDIAAIFDVEGATVAGTIFGFVVDESVENQCGSADLFARQINYFERWQQKVPRSQPFMPPAGEDRGSHRLVHDRGWHKGAWSKVRSRPARSPRSLTEPGSARDPGVRTSALPWMGKHRVPIAWVVPRAA